MVDFGLIINFINGGFVNNSFINNNIFLEIIKYIFINSGNFVNITILWVF